MYTDKQLPPDGMPILIVTKTRPSKKQRGIFFKNTPEWLNNITNSNIVILEKSEGLQEYSTYYYWRDVINWEPVGERSKLWCEAILGTNELNLSGRKVSVTIDGHVYSATID